VAALGSSFPVWVDAQLPSALARWLQDLGESQAVHVEDLGLLRAEDPDIFERARQAKAVVITKDSDFVQIQERRGAPPRIIWVTCGNCTNPFLRELMTQSWLWVKQLLAAGEVLVEINQGRGLAS
jgi:predicted nuclease of predicted toxin-antitoxin system